jgi:protein TonB
VVLLAPVLWGCGEGEGVDPPEPLFGEASVRYPLELWDEDVEGETLLRVLVNATGGVDSVEVIEPSGFAAFDSAAVNGARDFRFDPARRGDERVTAWAQVPVRFSKRPRSEMPP